MDGGLDYALLDRLGVGSWVFYPRRDPVSAPPGAEDLAIPLADGTQIGARFYHADPGAANILYFHGNGEVASDHDELAEFYEEAGANLFVAEFRGYGKSTGRPSLEALVMDAHPVAAYFHALLDARGYTGKRYIMGRSLGSQPALELAANGAARFAGLIIESGAGNIRRLVVAAGGTAESGEGHALADGHEAKVRGIRLPVLILHGSHDELVPLEQATTLLAWLDDTTASLVVIAGAGHNDIVYVGFEQYFGAIAQFVG